jgi:hypothetical protein
MSSTEVLFLGAVTPGSFVSAGERFRVALRDTPTLLGAVFTTSFDARVKLFLETLPGASSSTAFAYPPAATDLEKGVAVIDVRVLSGVPWGFTAAQLAERLQGAVAGVEVFRLTGPLSPESLADGQAARMAELAVAVAGDAALDHAEKQESLLGKVTSAPGNLLDSLTDSIKGLGRWVLWVLFALIALGVIYLLSKRRSAPSV